VRRYNESQARARGDHMLDQVATPTQNDARREDDNGWVPVAAELRVNPSAARASQRLYRDEKKTFSDPRTRRGTDYE